MGRAPCCDKANVKKGPWSPEEDSKLKEYIQKHGTGGNWIALPQKAGLRRCGKSCRLRWLNYLRPNIKHGEFSDEEDRIICSLYSNIGSRWSIIAAQLPGRTDNDIKNYWNTKLKKKLMGFLPASPHHRSKLPPYHKSPPQNPPPSFPPSHYRDYCSSSYYNPSPPPPNHISFTTTTGHLEPISVPSSSCYTSTTTASIISHPFYQNQESSLVSHVISPMQCYNYPITTDRSLLMFGSEASCSSSDGSCSHGKQEEMMMGFQNFMYSSSNKSMLCNDGGEHVNQYCWEPAEKPISNGCFFQTQSGGSTSTPLDYDLEVIKQLISSNSSSGFGFSVDDENKTEEKAMLY